MAKTNSQAKTMGNTMKDEFGDYSFLVNVDVDQLVAEAEKRLPTPTVATSASNKSTRSPGDEQGKNKISSSRSKGGIDGKNENCDEFGDYSALIDLDVDELIKKSMLATAGSRRTTTTSSSIRNSSKITEENVMNKQTKEDEDNDGTDLDENEKKDRDSPRYQFFSSFVNSFDYDSDSHESEEETKLQHPPKISTAVQNASAYQISTRRKQIPPTSPYRTPLAKPRPHANVPAAPVKKPAKKSVFNPYRKSQDPKKKKIVNPYVKRSDTAGKKVPSNSRTKNIIVNPYAKNSLARRIVNLYDSPAPSMHDTRNQGPMDNFLETPASGSDAPRLVAMSHPQGDGAGRRSHQAPFLTPLPPSTSTVRSSPARTPDRLRDRAMTVTPLRETARKKPNSTSSTSSNKVRFALPPQRDDPQPQRFIFYG